VCAAFRHPQDRPECAEEPKTACQRKPTAPLAMNSSERRHKKPFARLPTALSAAAPYNSGFFIKQKGN